MTREEAKQLLPVIQAYAEGAEIQFKSTYNGWGDIPPSQCVDFTRDPDRYRIKPKPVKGWVNIYRHESPENFHGACSAVHPTKEQADKTAAVHRIACVEIEIPA